MTSLINIKDNPWGWHLVLNAFDCDLAAISDYQNIYDFTKELVVAINMEAYGEPQIVKFGHGNKEGYTLVQLISTSNICAHFTDESKAMYFDCFSCKPFDPDIVIDLVQSYFGARDTESFFLQR